MLWKVRTARTSVSMDLSGRADLVHESQVVVDVTLQRIKPQESLARLRGKFIAQSRLMHQSRQRCTELFARLVDETATRCLDRLATTAGISHDGGRATGKRLDD